MFYPSAPTNKLPQKLTKLEQRETCLTMWKVRTLRHTLAGNSHSAVFLGCIVKKLKVWLPPKDPRVAANISKPKTAVLAVVVPISTHSDAQEPMILKWQEIMWKDQISLLKWWHWPCSVSTIKPLLCLNILPGNYRSTLNYNKGQRTLLWEANHVDISSYNRAFNSHSKLSLSGCYSHSMLG
jgi:hypothetical protein